jgi:[ribosomal protein S5]-alanine N-acetyltransferase
MKLKTERLIIRSLEPKDAKELSILGNNPKIAQNLTDAFPNPYTLQHAKQWIKKNNDPKSTNYVLTLDNKVIGGIGLSIKNGERKHVAEVGYWIGEAYWGKGIATEALKAITEYTFKTFKVERIEAKVYTWNPTSGHILEKVGYKCEGLIRSGSLKGGKPVDEYLYSILRKELKE